MQFSYLNSRSDTSRPRPVFRKIGKLVVLAKFIEGFQKEHGFTPSLREMAARFNVSSSVIGYYLENMELLGIIEERPFNVARAIRLVTGWDKIECVQKEMEKK